VSFLRRISLFLPKSLLAAALFFALTASGRAADITIAWDANTEPDLAGYKVYYGTASGVFGNPIVLGIQTTYTITGLPAGTYYIAVTAFNKTGLESGFSNEVSTILAGTPTTSKCDINGDGAANALDLQIMVNLVLGLQAPPAGKADLNGDGKIDALDLQILGNVILGIRSCPL
jgi:chitinase